MDFKSLLSQLDQLNEATTKTKTGLKHTAEPGGYGRKDDEDEEGNKVKAASTEKRGKGRPKKATQSSGEDKKYDFSAFGVKHGKDVKLPKHDKKKTTKHTLKDWFEQLDKEIMNEAEQIQIKPASQMPKQPGQTSMGQKPAMPGQQQQVAGQPQKNTQVIQQGNKTLGTVDNPQLANQIKQSIGKGEMTLMPDQMHEEDIGKHNNATTGFDALVKKLTPKYGVEAAKRIAGSQMKKIKEADQPPNDSLLSPMSEARAKADNKAEKAGKKVTKDLEYDMKHKGKDDAKAERAGKEVTKDIEYDEKKKVKEAKDLPGNQDKLDVAEPKGKLDARDFKELSKKKKVKEGMEHKLKAARHTGKAHALSKQAYNCNYDDMEESKHYHEGFKEGLDECYGQMPIQGYVGEANNEVADMASYGAHTPTMEDDMYEMDKTSYMKQQAIKTPGDTFKAFGQTFKDKEVVESPFAFEAWEKELNSILEGKEVTEGMTVSISKGQQGTPDSVSVSAQDAEADQLLGLIKSAGLGLFGGDDVGHSHTGQPMTVDVDGGEGPQANIEVVDDHDDMLSLIRKMTGQGPAQSNGDYEEEGGHGHDHGEEETCESCGGMMEEGHSCGEAVEENETIPQAEEEVAEEINPNNNDEAEEEQTDATRDAALATAAGKNFADTDAPLEEGGDGGEASDAGAEGVDIADVADETEEDLEESLANGADDTFESDIDFMTNVITAGLNGKKRDVAGNGQSTINVTATRPMKESTDLLHDWRKLSGIK